jgi:hypothetical protein
MNILNKLFSRAPDNLQSSQKKTPKRHVHFNPEVMQVPFEKHEPRIQFENKIFKPLKSCIETPQAQKIQKHDETPERRASRRARQAQKHAEQQAKRVLDRSRL